MADSGGLFAECAELSVGLAVICVTDVIVVFVAVVFYVAFVNVWCSSSSVMFVGVLLNVCENGLFKAARKCHPHAIGVFCSSATVKVAS